MNSENQYPNNEAKPDESNTDHDQDLEIDNLPNRITIFRVCLIPIILVCLSLQIEPFHLPDPYKVTLGWVAAWTFVLASITDFFDGYIARKRNIVTIFGSFLDPIADKFLTVSALILLLAQGRVHALIVTILVLREIYMTSLRLLAFSEGVPVPVNKLGKWKTATQMTGLPMLMAYETVWYIPFATLGTIFVYIASILSFYSSIVYSVGLVKKLKLKRLERKQKKKLKN